MNFQKKKENHFIQFLLKKTEKNITIIRENERKLKILSFAEDLQNTNTYNMDQVVARSLEMTKSIV